MRRDLMENFVKLVDSSVQMSGRSGAGLLRPSDASLRAHNKEAEGTTPTTPLEGPGSGKEILDASVTSEKGTHAPNRSTDSAREVSSYCARLASSTSFENAESMSLLHSDLRCSQLALFLARRVVPDFRRFSIDNDKLTATCGNIMYYNVSPSFKSRTR